MNQSVAKLNFPGSPFMSDSPMWLPTSYRPRSCKYTSSSSLMRSWQEASAWGDLQHEHKTQTYLGRGMAAARDGQ